MKKKKPGPIKGTKHKDIKRSEFGERLFKARKARGLTQQQLADKLGITRRMIAYYESDTEGPTIKGLQQIAKVLNVTASYLLGESTQKRIEVDIPIQLRKHVDKFKNLPDKDQKIISVMIDSLEEKITTTRKAEKA